MSYTKAETLRFLIENADHFAVDPYPFQCELQLIIAKMQARVKLSLGNPNAPTKLQAMWHEAPFRFALPHELDRTQFDDVCPEGVQKGSIKPRREHYISYGRDLQAITTQKCVLANNMRGAFFGIMPEISISGGRRCLYINQHGRRCTTYTHAGLLCVHHRRYLPDLKGYLMVHAGSHYSKLFQNSTLAEMYEDFKNSDARDITSEIAMMRTMLGSALKALPQEMDAGQVPFEFLNGIIKMTNTITSSIEKYDRMQQRLGLMITPEQMSKLLLNILSIIKNTLDLKAEQYAILANKMANLTVERHVAEYEVFSDNVESATYGDHALPAGTPEVKFSNRATRYSRDGEIRQVPPEAEIEFKEEQQDYLEAKSNKPIARRCIYYDKDKINAHTEVDGRPVEIGDPYDPYDITKVAE